MCAWSQVEMSTLLSAACNTRYRDIYLLAVTDLVIPNGCGLALVLGCLLVKPPPSNNLQMPLPYHPAAGGSIQIEPSVVCLPYTSV